MCKTLSLPLALFDHAPKRSELVKHPDVPMDSLATESVTGPGLVRSEAHGQVASLPRSTGRVPDILTLCCNLRSSQQRGEDFG